MAQLKKVQMVSYYEGEPSVAFSKATGVLTIWEEKVVFEKQLGNSAYNAFGPIGMIVGRNKALKENKTDTYMFSDIAKAKAGTYMAINPMLTLEMKDGSKHSFAGFMNAAECATMINSRLPSAVSPEKAKETPQSPTFTPPAPPKSASASETKRPFYMAFYYSGELKPGPKPVGNLLLEDDGLVFSGSVVGNTEKVYVSIPYVEIESIRQSKYMDMWPALIVTTKDGTIHNIFGKNLLEEKLEEEIERRVHKPKEAIKPSAPSPHRKTCKYCGYVYGPNDSFCMKCGAVEVDEA